MEVIQKRKEKKKKNVFPSFIEFCFIIHPPKYNVVILVFKNWPRFTVFFVSRLNMYLKVCKKLFRLIEIRRGKLSVGIEIYG